MDDREFWVAVRRGLMTIVDVIERKYDLPRATRYSWYPRPTPDLTHNGTTRIERASSPSTSTEREHG